MSVIVKTNIIRVDNGIYKDETQEIVKTDITRTENAVRESEKPYDLDTTTEDKIIVLNVSNT